MTYLAVPIAAPDLKSAKRQITAAHAAGAEMLELRTDFLENLSVDLLESVITGAKTTGLPVIVTCRDKRQGGANDYPEQLRIDVLAAAVKAGVNFIDCEFENFISAVNQQKIKSALAENPNARLILSAHNFKTRFEDISRLYRDILAACPSAIPKLIYTAKNINDCFEAFDLLKNRNGDAIIFAMGPAGVITRIVAKKLGSFVTFASIGKEAATAPGQLTIGRFRGLYRYDSINADTELFGVIAAPVAHSLSPHIHNACFADARLNKLYLPLLVEGGKNEFDRFLDNVLTRPWLNFKGFSVTIPHKANGLNYVFENSGWVEPLAEKIAAVNTLVIDPDGKVRGYNTDYTAAMDAITSTLGITKSDLKGLPVAVIGAGGVARAIVAGLSDVGAKIKIYNRTVKKAEKLAAEFGCEYAGLDDLANLDAKLVINCTSIGMHPHTDAALLRKEYFETHPVTSVFDAVYNPAETLLLRQAKEAGARTIDGLSMFTKQAAAQFKLFTSRDANPELMRKIVMEELIHR